MANNRNWKKLLLHDLTLAVKIRTDNENQISNFCKLDF
jgi:hypothetical protein